MVRKCVALTVVLLLLLFVGCKTAPQINKPNAFKVAKLGLMTFMAAEPKSKPFIKQAIFVGYPLLDKSLSEAFYSVSASLKLEGDWGMLAAAYFETLFSEIGQLTLDDQLKQEIKVFFEQIYIFSGGQLTDFKKGI